MPKNDSGYELHVGPDAQGRYFTVPPGEDYNLPEVEPAGEVEQTPPASASDRGGADQNATLTPHSPDGQLASVEQIDTPSTPPASASDRGGADQNAEK